MPIAAELRRKHYSRAAGWPEVCARVRERAGDRCECRGQCGGGVHPGGRCGLPHLVWIARRLAEPNVWDLVSGPEDGRVDLDKARILRAVLGVAHLDHNPANNAPENLLLCCQRCHLLLDRQQHASTRERARWLEARAAGQLDLVLDLKRC